MNIKATYHLTPDQIRAICIKYQWYSLGSCAAYDAMLRQARRYENMKYWDLETLEDIARDIIRHTDPARFAGLDGIGSRPDLEYVLYELGNAGVWTFES